MSVIRRISPGNRLERIIPELLRMLLSVGHAGAIVNGVPRIGFQKGGKTAQWKDEDMAELFLEKAKGFLKTIKINLSSCTMACINRMYPVYRTERLSVSPVWDLVEMLSWKRIGA